MLLAQISDLHITGGDALAYDVVDTTTAARRTVAYLEKLTPAPDLMLVTGDVTDDGSKEAYATARDILRNVAAPLLVVPGNHDHKERLQQAFGQQTACTDMVAGRLCCQFMLPPFMLVGVDSAIPGKHGGGLPPEVLEWLDQILHDGQGMPTVVFMHHPPFAVGIGNMDAETFVGREALEEVLSRHQHVVRLLTGHVHRPLLRQFGGTLAAGAPSTAMQLALDLTADAPSQFVMEPGGVALHFCPDPKAARPELVTHFGLLPDPERPFSGPHPFFGVVSPE